MVVLDGVEHDILSVSPSRMLLRVPESPRVRLMRLEINGPGEASSSLDS